jgi:hypothetical protein
MLAVSVPTCSDHAEAPAKAIQMRLQERGSRRPENGAWGPRKGNDFVPSKGNRERFCSLRSKKGSKTFPRTPETLEKGASISGFTGDRGPDALRACYLQVVLFSTS